MRKDDKNRKTLSLYVTKKIMPIVNYLKYIFFLGAIFFQRDETAVLFVICASIAIMLFGIDTFLKVSAWRCRYCGKVLPHDFYSRKTMEYCPNCHKKLDFEDHSFFTNEIK